MKGSLSLFRQAVTKCAEAHKVKIVDSPSYGLVTLYSDQVPLRADLEMICSAIFNGGFRFENVAGAGFCIHYGKAAVKEMADEQTLRLALPHGTELVEEETTYLDRMRVEAEESIKVIDKMMEELIRNPMAHDLILNHAGYWRGSVQTDFLMRFISENGKDVWINPETGEESYIEKGGFEKFGSEIDLNNADKKVRTLILEDRFTPVEWIEFFTKCITVSKTKTVTVNKVAVIDGGKIGMGDYGESVIRLTVVSPDGEESVAFYNDLGTASVSFPESQLDRLQRIIEYELHLRKPVKDMDVDDKIPF